MAPQLGTADAEIKHPSVENPELKGSPFKPGAGPLIAVQATPSARGVFLANSTLLVVHSLAFSPKPLPNFSCVDCS